MHSALTNTLQYDLCFDRYSASDICSSETRCSSPKLSFRGGVSVKWGWCVFFIEVFLINIRVSTLAIMMLT